MNIKERFKVDPDALGYTFQIQGSTVLIMDGDAACYEAACSTGNLSTAVKRVKLKIMEAMFLTSCSTARVHITPEGSLKNGRKHIKAFKPYQANRSDKAKPAILEPLRQCIQGLIKDDAISVFAHYDIEADDAIIQDSYIYKDCIVWSADKDLRLTPARFYDIQTGVISYLDNRFGYIRKDTTASGIPKPKGHGTKFFWWQMIMGDTADNVKGLSSFRGKSIGMMGGYEHINSIADESACANKVIDMYREIDQNPLPEGELMWLTRWPNDSFYNYINELNLSADNKTFIAECNKRDWREACQDNQ